MKSREEIITRIEKMAKNMRKNVLKMALAAGSNGAHLGSALSIIELTATLYGSVMKINPNNPKWDERDRFILSKGHGSLGYYTALAEVGYLNYDDLETFEKNEGDLPGQPSMNVEKGIELSSGSLGLGLSVGIGIALNAKNKNKKYNTYVLMGDGECNEGTVWEAAMAASHFKLNNLIAIIDRNRIQSDGESELIMSMGDFRQKWLSFGWEVVEIDGHNIAEIYDTLVVHRNTKLPYVIIANTTKGKGVSFMENNNEWHHNRLSQEQFDKAINELTIECKER